MMTIQQARVAVAPALNLSGGFDGSPDAVASLSDAEKSRLADATARFVLANPGEFTPFQVERAGVIIRAGLTQFEASRDPSLLDLSADFVKAYGETAGEFVEGAAGVAGRSAKAIGLNLGVVVSIAAVVAILYFGAPYVVPQLRKALQSKTK